MEKSYLVLGHAPTHEPCSQVGKPDYFVRSQRESREYIRMLSEMHPTEVFRPKLFEHDLGLYREVVYDYDPTDPLQCVLALHIEYNLPKQWDEQARAALS